MPGLQENGSGADGRCIIAMLLRAGDGGSGAGDLVSGTGKSTGGDCLRIFAFRIDGVGTLDGDADWMRDVITL